MMLIMEAVEGASGQLPATSAGNAFILYVMCMIHRTFTSSIQCMLMHLHVNYSGYNRIYR